MKFKDFFNECNEKDVFKKLSLYVVSSWLLLQFFAITWEPLGLPKITLTYLLIILLIGFPLNMYLLWRFRLKSLEDDVKTRYENILVKDKVASSKSSLDIHAKKAKLKALVQFRSSFHKMYFSSILIISMITTVAATLIVKANFVTPQEENFISPLLETDASNKIAVLKFENNTMDEGLDVVGKMAVDWIMHGITQNKVGQVISPKIVSEYANVLKASVIPSGNEHVLKEYLKPSKIINGAYYLIEGQLLIQCSILDENMNQTLISFEGVSCDPKNPLDCIEALKQRILGYLVMEADDGISFEETPPKFEAYQYLLEAHTKYANTDPDYLKLLNNAIEADSTFFEAKVERLEYYYNNDEFAVVDSLYQILSKETSSNKRQLNLLNWYDALLKGDNRNIYKYFKNEYAIEPFDLENNSTAMVLALQFVNRPQDVDAIFKALSMDDMDLDKCLLCEYRNYTKALAAIELGKPNEAIELLEPYALKMGYEWVKEALLRAYISMDNKAAVDDLMSNIKLTNEPDRWNGLSVFCGKDFLLKGDNKFANKYFDLFISSAIENGSEATEEEIKLLPFAYYYKESFQEAEVLFEKLYLKNQDPSILSYLAIATYKNGDHDKALKFIEQLDSMRAPFQFGAIDYGMAQFYAAIGDETKAMDYLFNAVADGKRYGPSTFQYDIHFKPYINSEAFGRIMKFWH